MRKPLPKTVTLTLTILLSAVFALTAPPPMHGAAHLSVEVAWGAGASSPGAVSNIILTVRNIWDQPLTLRFVGVRFDWMSGDAYLYGGGSELERLMNPGDSASFSVYFNVPDSAAPGFHPASILLVYRVNEGDGLVEYHQFVEVRPGLNVVAAETLTLTETKVVTVNVEGGAVNASRVGGWPVLSTFLAGLAALLFAVWKRKARG